ncbi:MAG: histidine phosphatase family protein [Deltaproteobacteria bacterium]|nr:histidine phosphatase family protein [Deltaproteobacteria bacterium]
MSWAPDGIGEGKAGLGVPWEEEEIQLGTIVVLVRHGRTRWNHERRFLGTTDIPLDEVGRRQARSMAAALPRPFDCVYTSPLARAMETAEFLTDQPVERMGLRELWQGDLEGLSVSEGYGRYPEFFAAFARDPTHVRVPGGESLGACRDRAVQVMEEIGHAHDSGAVVAVVTHQMVIASVACTLAGEPMSRWRGHGVRNVAMTVLRRLRDTWSVVVEDWRFDDGVGRVPPDV